MIFLDYLYTLPNSTSGIDDIAIQTLTVVPGFVSMILFFVFLLVFIGGITRQKIRIGTADYASWCLIASLSVLIMSLLFSTVQGFIALDTIVLVVSLCILSSVWFFLDKRASEI